MSYRVDRETGEKHGYNAENNTVVASAGSNNRPAAEQTIMQNWWFTYEPLCSVWQKNSPLTCSEICFSKTDNCISLHLDSCNL